MARLPDYSARVGLNPGSAPQLSVDRSGLAQVANFGSMLQGVGQDLKAASDRQKQAAARAEQIEQQKQEFRAKQDYAQMNALLEQDRVSMLEQAPPDGSGFTRSFVNDALQKRQQDFLGKVPEYLQDQYRQQLQTDSIKLVGLAGQNERDRLYANSEQVIGEQSNQLLNRISLNAASYDEALRTGIDLIDASPLPPIKKAEAKRIWESAALSALAQKMIADDPEAAKAALGGSGPDSARFSAQVNAAIETSAAKYGVNADALKTIALIESGGNPSAKNPSSSAGGLFQFINSTAKQYGLKNRYDANQAADAAARLMRDNAAGLRKALGRAPTTGELYLAHQQGLGGAVSLLSNPGALAVDVVGTEAVKLNGGAPGMTAAQFAYRWTRKADAVSGAGTGVGGEIAPVFAGMEYGQRLKFLSIADRQVDAVERSIEDAQRFAKQEVTKTGFDLLVSEELTPEWVEENRDILSVSDYKTLLRATVPGESPKRTDPKEYIRLLDLADSNPEQAIEEVRQQYGEDLIAKDVFNKIYSRANANVNRETGSRYESEMRGYVRRMLAPAPDAPRSHYSRQLDAAFAFDDWFNQNENASREDMRAAADGIIQNYRGLRYGRETTEIRPPRFLDISQPVTPKTIAEARAKAILMQKLGESTGMGLTKQEFADEAGLLRQWTPVPKE